MKVIVFDIGGTLMEYTGMPLSWVDYYKQGFEYINLHYDCGVSDADIQKSIEILTRFNPRINPRENELAPEYIFGKCTEHWSSKPSTTEMALAFYNGLSLRAEIYPDTIPALQKLKRMGYAVGALTDLPTAMPDELFKKDIAPLLEHIDLYVSSQSCGFRKPHNAGLRTIAEHFCVPMQELIYIGDEDKDRETALNAGCGFIKIDRRHSGPHGVSSLSEIICDPDK